MTANDPYETGGQECSEPEECTHPDCPRVFDTENGMRKHYGHVHGGIEKTCQQCGQVEEVSPHRANRSDRFYCGQACAGKAQRKRVEMMCEHCGVVEEVPVWRANKNDRFYCSQDCSAAGQSTQIEVVCDHCGGTFDQRPAQLERTELHFCGESCHVAHQRGENHPNQTHESIPCNHCGDSVPVPRWRRERQPNHYCDDECYAAHLRSGVMAGENNPSWNGGRPKYGPGWTKAKKALVRERDGHQCQSCGLSGADHADTFGRRLSVHHITPARLFDDAEKRNAMGNLITLCMKCHHRWDLMYPLVPDH